MASEIDAYEKAVEEGLIDAAKTYDKQLDEQMRGTLLGSSTVDDVTHAELYLLEMHGMPPNPVTGHPGKQPRPLMPEMLKVVQGGKAEINRFGRTLAKAMAGEIEPGPLLAREIARARTAAAQVVEAGNGGN